MVGSDAWNKKSSAHASTQEMELMHEAEKQGAVHHFSSLQSLEIKSMQRPIIHLKYTYRWVCCIL